MFCDVVQDKAVRASFEENGVEHEPCIHFYDPSYVCSEAILFDPDTRSVHAVLHEALHFLGQLPENMTDVFTRLDYIALYADHYSGTKVRMRAPVCVSA